METMTSFAPAARISDLLWLYWRICSWQKGQPRDRRNTTRETPASRGSPSTSFIVVGVPSRARIGLRPMASRGSMVLARSDGLPDISAPPQPQSSGEEEDARKMCRARWARRSATTPFDCASVLARMVKASAIAGEPVPMSDARSRPRNDQDSFMRQFLPTSTSAGTYCFGHKTDVKPTLCLARVADERLSGAPSGLTDD